VSITLYMDVHVPRAITRALRTSGIDVLTAQEDSTTRYSDSKLLDRAADLGRVVFTRDEDFLVESARRQRGGIEFRGVIYAHQLRVSIGDCVRDLELICLASDAEEYRNHVQHLPLH
jgi:uncharacterized protein with PIN domain